MPESGPITSRIHPKALVVPALLAGLALAACSGDSSNGGGTTGLPASTSYVGIYASTTGATGPISITFTTAVKAPPVVHNDIAGASAAPNNATGTVGVNGTDVAITGSLDGSALHMTGAGGLDLAGTLANGVITGNWSTTGGESGNFAAASNSEGTPAYNYCGYYSGTVAADQSTESGTFNTVIAGAVVQGVAVSDNGDVVEFKGTATPTSSGGTFKINQSNSNGTLTVNDGTYGADGISGHYATSSGGVAVSSGTFSGSLGCPVL
jgi:hypothetical protein